MNNLPRNATALEKRTSNFVRPPHHISNYSMHYLSAKALREREKICACAHTHKVGANLRELRESEKCQGQLQLHAKSSALTLSFPTHYILQPAENRSQEKEKLPVPLFLSLERPPTTFAGARLQTEA
jgi:hypothetical protein